MFKKCLVCVMITCLMVMSVGCDSGKQKTTKENQPIDSKQETKNSETSSKKETVQLEAPMLAERVAKGQLPPLEERLPAEAMVEPDVVELGEYGGSVNMTHHDNARWNFGPTTEQSLFRFKQDASGEVEPNICKNFYSNDDSTIWTVELRKGMKWSDGAPLTADDFEFYYNHMSVPALDADRAALSPDAEGYYNAYTSKPYKAYYVNIDGKNYWAEFNKIDDYKYTMTFKAPKPNFPVAVAVDNKWAVAPKHFFKNVVSRRDGVKDDPSFPFITEEEAIANANKLLDKNFDKYSSMGKSVGYYNWDFYQIPQLRSFIATKNNWDKVGEVYELVRNPYFFKTDSKGRQLPYLDSIKIHIINEEEQVVLKATAGEFDFYEAASGFSTIASSTKATHKVLKWNDTGWGSCTFALNQTVKDLDKRALFQNIDFRHALSIAVDRDLLNGTLMNNQSSPWQLSPGEGMFGYDEEWSKKWTEYDVDKANKLMDGLTEPWDGKEGTYRKMNGTDKDLSITILLSDSQAELEGDYVGLLTSFYRKIGIKILTTVQSDAAQIIQANNHECELAAPTGSTPVLRPDTMLPMRNYFGWYGAYGKWYEDNRSTKNGGIEPTGDMLELVNAYERILSATGPDRDKIVNENAQKIYDLHKKNIWVIGFLKVNKCKYIVNKNLMNVKEDIVKADEFRYQNFARPEQWYLKK